jgi:hypothetical protein
MRSFVFDKVGFYERLGWSILESGRFRGRAVTVMSVRVAGEPSRAADGSGHLWQDPPIGRRG